MIARQQGGRAATELRSAAMPARPRWASLLVILAERVSPLRKLLLAAEVLLAYAEVRRRVRRADIRNVVRNIRAEPATRPAPAGAFDEQLMAARLASAVRRTLRILPADTRCLMQSLVLSRLLSARAIPSRIVIGVLPKPNFAAHAWVEHAGRPILSAGPFSASRLFEI